MTHSSVSITSETALNGTKNGCINVTYVEKTKQSVEKDKLWLK